MAKVSLNINGRKYALGCDDGEEEYEFTLEQSVNADGHTVYDDGEAPIIADGQWHDSEESGEYKATCQSDTVLQIDGKDGDVDIETTITLTSANTSTQIVKVESPDFGEFEIEQTCTK